MRGSWSWWGWALALAGCWKPNPGFIGELPAPTTGGSGTGTGTLMSSGTDTTSSTSAAASSGAASSGMAMAGSTSTGAANTGGDTTLDPTGASSGGSTGGVDPQKLCDEAVKNQASTVWDFIATCGAMTTQWSYAPTQVDMIKPTMCAVQSPLEGIVQVVVNVTGQAGVSLDKALQTGPPVSVDGIVQGEYLGIDLTSVARPCVAARIDYGEGAFDETLYAQIRVRASGDQGDGIQLFDLKVPHDAALHPVVVPVPTDLLKSQIVDVILIVFRENGAVQKQPSLLWERPRIVDAGP